MFTMLRPGVETWLVPGLWGQPTVLAFLHLDPGNTPWIRIFDVDPKKSGLKVGQVLAVCCLSLDEAKEMESELAPEKHDVHS